MQELISASLNLPTTIEDLSKFVLVGREKLTSVRAEIRAIDKLNLAQEVRNQKREEAQMLSEALLDAEVKLGDLLKQIPKQPGSRTDLKPIDSDVDKLTIQKPKHEVITELGFNQKQVERFETLSNNKDLVEQVKAEARENDDIPTRTRVLDLAQQRKQREQEQQNVNAEYSVYIDNCTKTARRFSATIADLRNIDTDDKSLKAWAEVLDKPLLESELHSVEEALAKLIKIQKYLKGVKL